MPTPAATDKAASARERLTAKARRASRLRRRVVAGALASFVLAWGVISFTGPMGVTAGTTTTASTQSASPSTDDSTGSTDDSTGSTDESTGSSDESTGSSNSEDSGSSDESTGSSDSEDSGSSSDPVTTAQS